VHFGLSFDGQGWLEPPEVATEVTIVGKNGEYPSARLIGFKSNVSLEKGLRQIALWGRAGPIPADKGLELSATSQLTRRVKRR
jgi:hypothetical protein